MTVLSLAAVACGGRDPVRPGSAGIEAGPQPGSPGPTDDDAEPGSIRSATVGTSAAEATTSPPVEGGDEGTDREPADEPFRLAEAGPSALPILLWDRSGARSRGHGQDLAPIASGPLVEITDAFDHGLVIQREADASVIWRDAGDGLEELLVADGGQRLELEGSGPNEVGDLVVYYQRHEPGGPATERSTLRSYNLTTGEVIELAETGGWESSTSFAHLQGGLAVGRWTAEGWAGMNVFDLRTGRVVYAADEVGRSCFDGEVGCPAYDVATIADGVIYGMRPVWNDRAGLVDRVGLFRFDYEADTEELVADFEWDNGLWYPEDMVTIGDRLVISLTDGADPLPALVVELSTGEMWTLAEAGLVRPVHLS